MIKLFTGLNIWLVEHMGFDMILWKQVIIEKRFCPQAPLMIFWSGKIQKQKNSSTDKHLISVFYTYIFKKIISDYTKQAFHKY